MFSLLEKHAILLLVNCNWSQRGQTVARIFLCVWGGGGCAPIYKYTLIDKSWILFWKSMPEKNCPIQLQNKL